VLSTKVGRLLEPNPYPQGTDLHAGGFDVPDTLRRRLDYSADGVMRSIEDSLERLRLDRIDLVLVHDPDDHAEQAIGHAIPALISLRDQGVIGAVGLGMNQWQIPLRAVEQTDLDVVMIAGRWTLLDRSAAPLLHACLSRGVSIIAAAPFNSGLLARDWPPDDAHHDYGPVPPDVLELARGLARECRRAGLTLPKAAMQFPLRHPAVATVVSGMGSDAHVASAANWMRSAIPDDVWDGLDRYAAAALAAAVTDAGA
jgi:D-threo-aldose 1-dehydrogenase